MRPLSAALVLGFTVSFAGLSIAATQPNNPMTAGASQSVDARVIIAQRCHCVESRLNGSCKMRVCR
jgi:hypothetical protein